MNTRSTGQPGQSGALAVTSHRFAVGQGSSIAALPDVASGVWSPAGDSPALLECPECEGIGQVLGRACPVCGGSGECSRGAWEMELEGLR